MPTSLESGRARRVVVAATGVGLLVAGMLSGEQAAFASSASSLSDLQTAAADTTSATPPTSYTLTEDIDEPTSAVTVGAKAFTIDLAGKDLDLSAIQLTTYPNGVIGGATLTIMDSLGGGALVVDHSTGSASTAAIEVDSAAGASLTISGADVTAIASNAGTASGAAIGGATAGGLNGASGAISITGYSVVHATGSARGAAIGDGGGAGGASISINDHARVTATAPGSAAGIGGGSQPTGSAVGVPNVTVGDYATVAAASSGSGAAIGGGLNGGGGTISIHRFATVTANTPQSTGEAGIGDGEGADAGYTSSVTIDGNSTVTAYGGSSGGAAIGGGLGAYGNDQVSIADFAVVTAQASNGPGIGATKNRAGTTVSISGTADVTATGAGSGAAIGGGASYSSAFPSVGSNLTIGSGSQLTVSAASGVSAIGAGTGSSFGSLSNGGTLILEPSSTLTVPAAVLASSDGTFENQGSVNIVGTLSSSDSLTNTGSISVKSGGTLANAGTITNTGTINGGGTVANGGAILQNGTFAPASVTGNAFNVVYDGQGGTKSASSQLVYADSVAAAGQSLATAMPPSTGAFTGWNSSADGTGSALSSTTSLSDYAGATATGSPVTVGAYALYQIAPVLPTATTLPQAVVGTPYSATIAASSGTAPISYAKVSGDLPAGLSIDGSTGTISGSPTTAGTFTMTVQARNSYTASHSYTISVVPMPITLSVPPTAKGTTRYLAGSTASLKIGGLQANETYTVKIGGKTAATGKAASNSAFTKKVTIPKSIGDGSQTVSVSGGEHANAVTAKILTAAVSKSLGLKLSAKKVKHGKKIVVTISKLYAGESARVVFKGKHSKTAVGKATSKGVYVVTLKKGLAKGKYTVTVTGAETSRKASAKLTVS